MIMKIGGPNFSCDFFTVLQPAEHSLNSNQCEKEHTHLNEGLIRSQMENKQVRGGKKRNRKKQLIIIV